MIDSGAFWLLWRDACRCSRTRLGIVGYGDRFPSFTTDVKVLGRKPLARSGVGFGVRVGVELCSVNQEHISLRLITFYRFPRPLGRLLYLGFHALQGKMHLVKHLLRGDTKLT